VMVGAALCPLNLVDAGLPTPILLRDILRDAADVHDGALHPIGQPLNLGAHISGLGETLVNLIDAARVEHTNLVAVEQPVKPLALEPHGIKLGFQVLGQLFGRFYAVLFGKLPVVALTHPPLHHRLGDPEVDGLKPWHVEVVSLHAPRGAASELLGDALGGREVDAVAQMVDWGWDALMVRLVTFVTMGNVARSRVPDVNLEALVPDLLLP